MTDLNSLLIFASVVDGGSFSEAARRLQMPVSTVSRRVAELEDQLGVRLLERSTRSVRLSDIGSEVYAHARRTLALRESVKNIVSNKLADVSGLLRLSAPPSIADSLLIPLVCAFQASYPNVRVQIMLSDRMVDHIADEIDLALRVGLLKDSSLVARKLLTYRHRLVAAPSYLATLARLPQRPADLLGHRLIAFSKGNREREWDLTHCDGKEQEVLSFPPYLAMNDYTGLAAALVAGAGIGDLPPVVSPELFASGQLVEVMPEWRFPTFDLSLVHLGNRHISRPLRVFKEFSAQMAPSLFPDLPT
jgi:DNA-binding transcriptional LysR family regulator